MMSRHRRSRMKTIAAATILAASLAGSVAANADCGDPGQDPCTGPVPTVDQVTALLAELMDTNRPNEDKNDVVTPDLSPESIGYLDTYLDGRLNAHGDFPYDFVVTDIQPAPNNFAGATVAARANGRRTTTKPFPIVLVNQSGRWVLTRKSAISVVDVVWTHYEIHPSPGL
jgi:hypothetical protein